MEQPTRSLFEEASRGDAVAVDELLERFLPGLERYVRVHAGNAVKAHESSSDLVQSVCREALEQLARERFEYRGEKPFQQWLYRLATHKIQNRVRFYRAGKRDARREISPATRSGSAEEAFFLSHITPSQDAGLREELQMAKEAFATLSDKDQEIITLAEFEGLPHSEIAAKLGTSEAYSRVLLSRALTRLAKLGLRR